MSKLKLNIRKIKCIGECVKKGDEFLHPTTLQISRANNSSSCPSKQYLKNSKILMDKKCDSNERLSNINLAKFMSLPYLNLSEEHFLKIYEVESVEDFKLWVDNSIKENKSYIHINRIINAWIRVNYESLLKNNNFLEDIYLKIFKNYWNNMKISDDKFKKEVKKYIDTWFEKKNYDDFKFNMGNDLNKYLSKKYGKK